MTFVLCFGMWFTAAQTPPHTHYFCTTHTVAKPVVHEHCWQDESNGWRPGASTGQTNRFPVGAR